MCDLRILTLPVKVNMTEKGNAYMQTVNTGKEANSQEIKVFTQESKTIQSSLGNNTGCVLLTLMP